MSFDQLKEKLVGNFDCKQGAVRAVRFNGESIVCFMQLSYIEYNRIGMSVLFGIFLKYADHNN